MNSLFTPARITLILFVTSILPVVALADQRRPNIVMIMADDLGFECIGANGGTSYKTPVLDKQVGRILDQLDRVGARENTLVLFTGDHGTDQPVVSTWRGRDVAGGKGKTTDGGTRVPLIAHWRGKTAKGTVCNGIVDFSDFLPTMCAAVGASVPTSLGMTSYRWRSINTPTRAPKSLPSANGRRRKGKRSGSRRLT